jgi:glutathione S-transferase
MSRFHSISHILESDGLRMALLRGVPSPWSEAAKGIFHVKGLACTYGAQAAGDPDDAIRTAFGSSSVPVVLYQDEQPRSGWAEILLLAERLSDSMPLIPAGAESRVELFGVAHEICGEMGLGWAYRLHMVGDPERAEGAFPQPVRRLLAAKYGYNEKHAGEALRRVISTLTMLSQRLERSEFLVGDQLTAADIYWATFANLMLPLPEADMPAVDMIRRAYTCEDERVLEAISDRLRAHQRRIYDEYLELPVPL